MLAIIEAVAMPPDENGKQHRDRKMQELCVLHAATEKQTESEGGMSDEIKYEYKVQFMANRGSWVDCTPTFSNIINARVFKRRYESAYKHVQTRIVRRPAEWEVCE